jgi:type II secretory pathway component PulF
VNLAKKHLNEALGMSETDIAALSKDEVLPTLANKLGVDVSGATQVLLETYNPGKVWIWLAVVGASSIVLMVIYDRWIKWTMKRQEQS